MVACGLLILLNNSRRNYPFLISSDPITSEWTVIAYPEKTIKFTKDEIIQEKLVRNYVDYWFTITKNDKRNESLWQKCNPDDCKAPNQYEPQNYKCALYCASSDKLFEQFTDKILPEYRGRVDQASEVISVKSQLITMPPVLYSNQDMCKRGKTNLLQSYITLESSVNGLFNVLAFVEIGCEQGMHPATLGYYVKDFNSYRMAVVQEAK